MSYQTNYSFRSSRTRNSGSSQRGRSGGNRSKSNKQYIHPSKFVSPAIKVEIATYEPTHSFADFNIPELLKQNVAGKGYITPSAIQDQAIPHALTGRDVIGIANTGTGKTAAFALPLLSAIMADRTKKALIIAPTRELAQQIEVECRSFAKNSGLNGALIIGGSSMGLQLRELRNDPSIVIGTPGRLKDHVERGTLKLHNFNIAVLDEVDRMVDMGFITDIRFLLGELAQPRQSLFFSATVDRNIEGLINSFMNDPVTVSVKSGDTADNVEQNVVSYNGMSEKMDKLHNVLLKEIVVKTLIFEETQRNVDRLHKSLQERGFKVEAIHGGKSQGHRERAMKRFKANEVNILVATDVAARGIDVTDISHVVNYSVPHTYDDYVHRIGRAGRAGRVGYALTFVQ